VTTPIHRGPFSAANAAIPLPYSAIKVARLSGRGTHAIDVEVKSSQQMAKVQLTSDDGHLSRKPTLTQPLGGPGAFLVVPPALVGNVKVI
jgi:hypothetical protein